MSPLDQQHAMADLAGWERYTGAGLVNWQWAPGHIVPVVPRWCINQGDGLTFTGPCLMELPDYLHDLNATHEVLCAVLDDPRWSKPYSSNPSDHIEQCYEVELRWVVKASIQAHQVLAKTGDRQMILEGHHYGYGQIIKMLRATPAQIVEALLKATGKWVTT